MASQNFYTDLDLFKVSQLLNVRTHNMTTVQRNALAPSLGAANIGLSVWDTNLNTAYHWTGTVWTNGAAAISAVWGSITGTITAQTDLIALFNTKANISSLAAVALTGQYSDLLGLPTLAPVATSGLYSDLTGKPVLAPVATSGLYSDLTGKPTLATVATSGQYNDLLGKPVLASVATSGSYLDLSDKPTIPAATTPAGSTTQIQYNNSGAFGASADFSWDDAGKNLNINGALSFDGAASHVTFRGLEGAEYGGLFGTETKFTTSGTKFVTTEASVIGTGDLFFQVYQNNPAGYSIFEAYKGLGLFLTTSSPTGTDGHPIIFGIDRIEKMRLHGSGNITITSLKTTDTAPTPTGTTKRLVSDDNGLITFTEDYSNAFLSIYQRNMQNFI